MKRLLLALAVVVSGHAVAGPDDIVFTRRNSTDTGQGPVIPAHPTSPGLMYYDSATLTPGYVLPGACLVISSGVLALTTACTPVSPDWAASSGLGQILNKPSAFPPASHTHSASDIVSGVLDIARIPALAISNVTGLQTALNGKFNQPSGTTAQYIRGDGSLAAMPAATPRSFSYTTRALNTCFQPSATRDVLATYSVDIQTSLSLTAGQQGTVYLRTYTNSSCTTGAQELTRFVNGQTGALTIGLALTQNVTGTLTGVIPAGSYAQLATENNTGTPTFTARPGQEVQL